jgi:hypothetical protein
MVRETDGQVKYRSAMEPIAGVYGELRDQNIGCGTGQFALVSP